MDQHLRLAVSVEVGGADVPSEVDAPVQLVTADNAQQAIESFPEPPSPYENPFAG